MNEHEEIRWPELVLWGVFCYGGGGAAALGIWQLLGSRHEVIATVLCFAWLIALALVTTQAMNVRGRQLAEQRARAEAEAAGPAIAAERAALAEEARLDREIERDVAALRADHDDPTLRN